MAALPRRIWLPESFVPGDLYAFGLDPLSIVAAAKCVVTATGGALTVVPHGGTLTNAVNFGSALPANGVANSLGRHQIGIIFQTTQIKNATAAAVQYQIQYPTVPNPAFGRWNVIREGSENNSISAQFPTVPANSTIYDFTWGVYTSASVAQGTAPVQEPPINGFNACNIVFTNQDAASSLSVLMAAVLLMFPITQDQPTLASNNIWQ